MSPWIPIDTDVAEVRLKHPPLELVILNVQFPRALVRLNSALEAGKLQELLADEYPYEEVQLRPNFTIDAAGGVTKTETKVHILHSADRKWSAMAASDSVSLVSQGYTNRGDFFRRAEALLDHVAAVASPPGFARIGVRYLNRVANVLDSPDWLTKLDPGVLGPLALLDPKEWQQVAESLVSVSVPASVLGSTTRARWGLIPPNTTLDPSLQAVATVAWVLDIDSALAPSEPEPWARAKEVLGSFTEDSYRVFRSILSDAALERFEPEW